MTEHPFTKLKREHDHLLERTWGLFELGIEKEQKLQSRITQLEADKRVLVEALEEISNDWVEVNRVGMSHIAAKALAQVKGDK